MESLEWSILDRDSFRNFILGGGGGGGGGGKLMDHVAVRPWREEGRPNYWQYLGEEVGGGGGGGGSFPRCCEVYIDTEFRDGLAPT